MQVGGIGNSGLDNHNSSHQVTGCMHEHHTKNEKTGGMRASSFSLSDSSQNVTGQAQEMSLVDTLRGVFSKGFGLLGRLWGGGSEGAASQSSLQSDVEGQINQTTLHQAELHQPTVAAAASTLQPDNRLSENPYFTTSSDSGKTKETLLLKIRVRMRELTGQLSKRFGGRFGGRMSGELSGKSLASGQQKSREDLRRRSRYRDDDIEIDCVLTDDSYLMDSYDRKGAYSKLTTEYKGQDKK